MTALAKQTVRPVKLVIEVWHDFSHNVWLLLVYDIIFAFVGASLLTPLLSWAIRSMAFSKGTLSVSNGEVLSFMFSLQGLVFIVLLTFRFVLLLYLRHVGMMLIVWSRINERYGVWPELMRAFSRHLPSISFLGLYQTIAHAIFVIPFVLLGVAGHWFLIHYRLYYVILENNALQGVALCVIGTLVAAFLLTHGLIYCYWVFSLPALLLEGYSLRSALSRSRKLLRGTDRRTAVMVFLFWVVLLLSPFLLIHLFKVLGAGILAGLPADPRKIFPVVIIAMAGYLAISFICEFLAVAVNSLTIMRLYVNLTSSESKRMPLKQNLPGASWRYGRRLLVSLLGASMLAVAGAATILGDFDLQDRVQVTAHRGSSFRAPENTLSAVRAAIEDRADSIEIDVRLTADGRIVLFHDADLFRVAGIKKRVSRTTYQELKGLDVGSWFGPRFRGERIPLLSEVIAEVQDKIDLNIELKSDGDSTLLIKRLVRLLEETNVTDQCVVSSSHLKDLAMVRQLNPDIRIGYVVSQAIGSIAECDVDFFSVSARLTRPGLIDATHAAGKEIHVWTVNKPRKMAHFIDLGVDHLITDEPAAAKRLLAERAQMSNEELLLVKVRSWFLK